MPDLHHVCNQGGDGDYNDGDVCPKCLTKFQAFHDEKKPGFVPDTYDAVLKVTVFAVPGKLNGVRKP